jgi:hypothetical protein
VQVSTDQTYIEDRIDHKLVWTVKGDVSSSIRPRDFNPALSILLARKEQVFFVKVGAKGQHRVVLDEQQRVRQRPVFHKFGDPRLDSVSVGIGSVAEVDDEAH